MRRVGRMWWKGGDTIPHATQQQQVTAHGHQRTNFIRDQALELGLIQDYAQVVHNGHWLNADDLGARHRAGGRRRRR